jgi:hypothetical protein
MIYDAVLVELTKLAEAVLADMVVRYPCVPLLEALMCLYPQFWEPPAGASEDEMVAHIQKQRKVCKQSADKMIAHFGNPIVKDGEQFAEALIDGVKLREQMDDFCESMCEWTKEQRQPVQPDVEIVSSSSSGSSSDSSSDDDGAAAATPKKKKKKERGPSKAQLFWRAMSSGTAGSYFEEWMVMAKLAFTMVPGSVEEERMFSAMKFLKNPQRNRLLAEYLSAAARLFKTCDYTVETFPFSRALQKWHEMKDRRMAG